jgi:hypothetical protein
MGIRSQTRGICRGGPTRVTRFRYIEFTSTIEAYPVGTMFNREYATHVLVMTAKGKLENPKQRIHRS